MRTIIRIEHPRDGNGLFSAQDENKIYYYKKIPLGRRIQSSFYFFPSPRQDNKIKRNPDSNEYCAFLTIADLNQHLKPEWIYALITAGFKIYAIKVSQYVEGEYQSLFRKEHILQQKDISSLFL